MGELAKDVTIDTARALKGPQHHEPVKGHYRPRRGQAYVRLEEEHHGLIQLPKGDPRLEKIHRGMVLDLGEPARLTDHPDSPQVPWDLRVGDTVYFHMAVWLDRMRVMEFVGVAGNVAVIAHGEIVAVEGVNERDTMPELPGLSGEGEECDD